MMMGSGEEGEEGCAGGEATAMSSAASTGRGQEVVLHVYDVGRTGCDKTDRTVRNINRFFKDCIGVGGIFHTAVQVTRPRLLRPLIPSLLVHPDDLSHASIA